MNATIQSVYRLACWLRITKVGNKAGPAILIYAIPHRAHTKTAFMGATTPSTMAQLARKDRHAEKSPGTGSVRAIHRFPRRCHGITQTTSPWMIYEKSTAVYRPRYECHAAGSSFATFPPPGLFVNEFNLCCRRPSFSSCYTETVFSYRYEELCDFS